MIEFLLLDMDDTILDFKKAEEKAIKRTLSSFGVEPTEAVCSRYSYINQLHWEALERKEITREQVLTGRFAVLFGELDVSVDPQECAGRYTKNLALGSDIIPGTEDVLKALQKKYKLYLASNGTTWVQKERIKASGIGKYFEAIFISQEVGAHKPDPAFFDHCFATIPGFEKSRAMIAGDSLTSDILGGNKAGIATCWVNRKGKPQNPDIVPTYEIRELSQLEALLETL